MKKVKIGILLILIIQLLPAFTHYQPTHQEKKFVVVLDPGHGGKDPGAVSHGIREKDIVLSISKILGKLIQDSLPDVSIVYTREKDVFVELWERSAIANKAKANLFLSIHSNATDNGVADGTETFVMGLHKNEGNLDVAKRENASILLEDNYDKNDNYGGFDPNSPVGHIIFSMYQNAFLSKSLEIAAEIENEFKLRTGLKSRGVKQAGFLVLWKTSMPSVLIETGFITNERDRKIMQSIEGQQTIAYSVFKAFKKYYHSNHAKITP
jgi:N-acetylmuramoyl-L-alanine amidase